jgi:hypothetical protein
MSRFIVALPLFIAWLASLQEPFRASIATFNRVFVAWREIIARPNRHSATI